MNVVEFVVLPVDQTNLRTNPDSLLTNCNLLGTNRIHRRANMFLTKYRRLGVVSSCENTPEPGNRFRLRLRCVRACVRAKLRERGDSSVARVGEANLWGSVRPFVLDFQSQPGELQIGLSCFPHWGKPVIVVVAVVRLDPAF